MEPPGDDPGLMAAGEGVVPGSRIAGYQVVGRIGRGGMAVVFRARDERLGRLVALKILAPALAEDEEFRQRFIRESRAAAAVDDPHIIPVFEAGEAGGVLYIAMRYVAGGDVRSLVRRAGPLPALRAVSIVSPVASALDAAHAAGLVHRDVKPANMLVDTRPGRPDHVYLSDFGLSKGALSSVGLTGSGLFMGTPDYISPEQLAGRAVDGRADQYALACTAVELLSGEPPFSRDHGMAVIYAHLNEPPPALQSRRPGLPAAVDGVISRALAKDPADRYPDCGQFADALRAALGAPPYQIEPEAVGDERPATVVAAAVPASPGASAGSPAGTSAPDSAPTITSPGAIGQPSPGGAPHDIAGPPGDPGGASGPRVRGRRRRRVMAAVGALIVVAGVAVALPSLIRGQSSGQNPGTRSGSGAHARTPAGNTASTPALLSIPGQISAVAAAPDGSAWAVGQSCPSECGFPAASRASTSLIVHWNGSAWSRVPSPSPGMDANLDAVTTGPGGTAWAVGQYCATGCPTSNSSTVGTALIVRWDGSAWTRVPGPEPGSQSYLAGVAAGPGGTAWAVGSCACSTSQSYSAMILRWDGSAWSSVPTPNPGTYDSLGAVSVEANGTAWAVGSTCQGSCTDNQYQTLILRWDGSAWSQVPSPSPARDNYVSGIASGQGATVWAVGQACTPDCVTSPRSLLLRWNGSAWASTPTAPWSSAYLDGVSAGPGGTAWAVGALCGNSGNKCTTLTPLILRWDGSAWSRAQTPSLRSGFLNAVSTGPASTAWAAGMFCAANCGSQTARYNVLILHWNGSNWSRFG